MNENKELIGIVIAIAGGAFSILASIFNWNFFFENKKTQLLMKIFGRTGSRIFYSILGCFLFFCAYKIIAK